MTDALVITGTYADFKFVKTRKQCQVIIEFPSEQSERALAILGGMPNPAAEQPVAIALLKADPKADHIYGGNDGYVEGSAKPENIQGRRAVTRAGMLCDNPEFQRWIIGPKYVPSAFDAARLLRERCGVTSRRDLAVNPEALEKFLNLETEFTYKDTRR